MRRLLLFCAVLLTPVAAWAQYSISPCILGLSGCTFSMPILGPAYDNCATPPYSFQGDPTTGLCSSADGVVHLRSNGVNVFSVSGTAVTSTVPILLPNGSGTAPGLTFANSTGIGFLLSGGEMQFASGGGAKM